MRLSSRRFVKLIMTDSGKQTFIKRYEKYYFNRQKTAENDGVPKNLKTTRREVEDFFFYRDGNPSIVRPLSDDNVEYAVAWKAGQLKDDLNSQRKPDINKYDNQKKSFKIGRSGSILSFEGEKGIKAYYEYLNDKKKEIVKQYQSAINSSDGEINQNYLTEMYKIAIAKKAKKEYVPNGIGSAPDKTSVSSVVNMYAEYLGLLKRVFGYCDIERGLDRALWVYGHCTKPYMPEV